jgi:hypothetical protein
MAGFTWLVFLGEIFFDNLRILFARDGS